MFIKHNSIYKDLFIFNKEGVIYVARKLRHFFPSKRTYCLLFAELTYC